MSYLIFGLVIGYFMYPLTMSIRKIITNTWGQASKTNSCNGNCNQGRKCDCGAV
jgi:hypothetical protein